MSKDIIKSDVTVFSRFSVSVYETEVLLNLTSE